MGSEADSKHLATPADVRMAESEPRAGRGRAQGMALAEHRARAAECVTLYSLLVLQVLPSDHPLLLCHLSAFLNVWLLRSRTVLA